MKISRMDLSFADIVSYAVMVDSAKPKVESPNEVSPMSNVSVRDRKVHFTEWLSLGSQKVDEAPDASSTECNLVSVAHANKWSRRRSISMGEQLLDSVKFSGADSSGDSPNENQKENVEESRPSGSGDGSGSDQPFMLDDHRASYISLERSEEDNERKQHEVPAVTHKRLVCNLESLSSAKILSSISVSSINGDVLYVDDNGGSVGRLRVSVKNNADAAAGSSKLLSKLQLWISHATHGRPSESKRVATLYSAGKKEGRIGSACWLHKHFIRPSDIFAFTQGRRTVKIFDAQSMKIIQRIRINRRAAHHNGESDLFHSCLFERGDSDLMVGFSGGCAIHVCSSLKSGRYRAKRNVAFQNRILSFTHNSALDVTGVVFYGFSVCPVLLDKHYNELCRLQINRRDSMKARHVTQMLVLDNGTVLLNDWCPPCKVEVYNLEGHRLGLVQMAQVMVTTWSIKRHIEKVDNTGSEIARHQSAENGVESMLLASRFDIHHHSLLNIKRSTRSIVYLYDMTLGCLTEVTFDSTC